MSSTSPPFRVLKFGGTSVTGLDRVEVIAGQVRERVVDHTPVVVVSAFAGVTDALIAAVRAAASGRSYEEMEAGISSQHLGAARALLDPDAVTEAGVVQRLDQLGRLLRGAALLGECSPRTLDSVLAVGEGLSCAVIAAALRARGLPAKAVDPGRWIITDDHFGEAAVDMVATLEAVRREAAATDGIPIVPGFIGASQVGDVTTLGRGGSDHSGAVLGVCLPADLVEIWTDVDGVMSADPRVVPEATSLEEMSFHELLELSHWGAKVVHQGAARLLCERGVPLVIRNTLRPDHPGTRVTADAGSGGEVPVRALASRTDAAVLQLSARAGDDAAAMTARSLAALHSRRVRVILVTQGGSEAAVCLVVPSASADTARAVLAEEFHLERETGLVEDLRVEPDGAVIAAVGDGMRHRPGVSGRIFSVLAARGDHHRLRLIGIASSRAAVVNRARVDLNCWQDAMAAGDVPAAALVEAAIDSPHHPRIFVDCTASSLLPESYERLLAAGVSVVAANKVGFAGSGESWERLHEVAREGGAIYYETTVGAGLPVLRTVADLAATGDQIVRLQGVLSGTLGYLCDEVMKGRRFSEAVRGAHELGYTEPDPRDDLSGLDVARKLVILARSASLDLEPEAVSVEPLLPREGSEGPLEVFWELLASLDEPMEKRRAEAAASGGRLVYLGTVEPGKASVGLEVVPSDHPCWTLHGSENLILVVSERYHTVPLVVRGPGAGPAVTAAGVFADVLRARAEAQEAPVGMHGRKLVESTPPRHPEHTVPRTSGEVAP
jgi:aspartate kinase